METCGNELCRKPFKPVVGQESTQKYCSPICGNRQRVRDCLARKRANGDGGGPGGKRQRSLFSRSELHRRKTNKAAMVPRPKTGDLFPPDEGRDLRATFGGAVSCAGDGAVSDNLRGEHGQNGTDYSKYSVKSRALRHLPPQSAPATSESPIAA